MTRTISRSVPVAAKPSSTPRPVCLREIHLLSPDVHGRFFGHTTPGVRFPRPGAVVASPGEWSTCRWFAQIIITNSTLAFDMQNLARLRSCLHEGNYLHTGSWRFVPHPSLTPNPPNHPPQSPTPIKVGHAHTVSHGTQPANRRHLASRLWM